jgi:hypothetical protein
MHKWENLLCFQFLTADDMTDQEIVENTSRRIREVTDGDKPDEDGNL